MAHYLDSSALVKLVIDEDESDALAAWLADGAREPVTSDLARTEVIRAIRRWVPGSVVEAQSVFDSLTILTLSTATFESAARLEPLDLRSLDALHLASALELGDELEGIVAYDDRLASAAQAYGVRVIAPR